VALDPDLIVDDLDDFDAPPIVADPATDDDAIAARCEASYAYTAFRDVYRYDVFPQPHLEAAEFIDAALGDYQFRGQRQLYMIGWPRHTFKTTLFAQGLPSLTLGRNPNARVLVSSFRHDVAKKRLRAVKRDLEHNTRFHDKFGDGWKPEFGEDVWNDDSIYVMRRTNSSLIDPSVATGGVDRDLTGAHFDLIIGDDFVTKRNVRTREMRDKVYEYILELLPILSPTGVLILIFTRWHVDDAYGRLIHIDEQRKRDSLKPFFEKTIHRAHNPDGTLFFPAVLTEAYLREQRERMGPRLYEAQYNNDPIADEDRTFAMDRARIRAFDFVPRRTTGGYVVRPGRGQMPVLTTLAWDHAGTSPSTRSDSHGLTVVGTDITDLRWVCEALSFKGRPSEVIDRVINLLLYYRVWALSVEMDGGGGVWLELLKHELTLRKIAWPWFYEFSTGGVPKGLRIATAVQPRWDRGGYIVQPSQHELLGQIEVASVAATADHEDVLDSLAQHESFARPPETWERDDDNPRDPEYDRYRRDFAKDREFDDRPGSSATRWAIDSDSSLTAYERESMLDSTQPF
jgi:hypothetical protein